MSTPAERGTISGQMRSILPLLLAIGATLVLYVPQIPMAFVDWDLISYARVLGSTDYVQTIVTLFKDVRGEIVPGYYAPLSSISLMLDNVFTGEPSAWITVFVNLLFHCLVGILVYLLAREAGADDVTASLSALIFLLHPVQASSILWFAQRKGVMAAAFYLGSYILFLKYAKTSSSAHYAASLLLFIAALFAKPTVVVFPIALVFTLVFLHEQLDRQSIGRRVLQIAPFFLIALLTGLVTMNSEGISYGETSPDVPLLERPFVAAAAIWFYVQKAFFPTGISPLYATWEVDFFSVEWWLPLGSLVTLAVMVFLLRKRLSAALLWSAANFLIPLFPVCGLLKFGFLRLSYTADHFMYLSMVGFAHFFAFAMRMLYGRLRPSVSYVMIACIAAYLAFLAVQTNSAAHMWKDSVTLWSHNLRMNPDNWTAHNFLGHALIRAGQPQESIQHFRKTLELKQEFLVRKRQSCMDLERSGNVQALQFEKQKIAPVQAGMYIAHHNLGNGFLLSGMHKEAAEQFRIALQLKPEYVNSRVNLGIASMEMGDAGTAIALLSEALQSAPNNFEAHYNIGRAYRAAGQKENAKKHFIRAHQLRPDYPLPPDS
ncbi:tetratricopeptide repeat protein [Desulfomonile tiedjei]|uniref:Tetratricopeptide repeat protein n=1 Tax=Desulfomonile tiedjei (strain ATCC 49306 / DSM 6799 / DCB-1) TaxID=706587 RepID=I4CAS7_DESTA|nr:tetratricopeptide repeat protein [Desulfomonile tiedjei]AFM26668.1 tetratricopeptide repeat protein [Desulfomonile tiedjei DSM 6799]